MINEMQEQHSESAAADVAREVKQYFNYNLMTKNVTFSHNYTAEQQLLLKRRARKSYDLPRKTSFILPEGNNNTS
jgi:hypothetical protein